MKNAADWVKASFQYEFVSAELLTQSLTHRSSPGLNNERLEFLGDAVLDTVISEVVYRQRPFATEGELSRLRSALVKDTSLAELAVELGIGDYLILGPGEKKAGGHRRSSILADAVEALFGAVYLDSGYAGAMQVIFSAFGDRLMNLPDAADLRDSKTRLQERLQAEKVPLPEYEVTDVHGQAHKQSFDVACRIPSLDLKATGNGGSRRDAEQDAADTMLELLDRQPARGNTND